MDRSVLVAIFLVYGHSILGRCMCICTIWIHTGQRVRRHCLVGLVTTSKLCSNCLVHKQLCCGDPWYGIVDCIG
jgi:hypothetical protein